MPILVTCTCGNEFPTEDENAGRRVRCPACGGEPTVPRTWAVGDLAGDLPWTLVERGPPRISGMAHASFALGIASLGCAIFTGIPALILGWLGLIEVARSGGAITGRRLAIVGMVLGGLGSTLCLIALPQVFAAREAARRSQCNCNLKQIAFAMLNYHEANGVLPPAATLDPRGKPLLSWRVLLLPYLEHHALYQQFKLDEPWDSPTNKPLLEKMPNFFQCPSSPLSSTGQTTYHLLVGPGTIFEKAEGIALAEVTDGTSNTLLVVESTAPTAWTRPGGLRYTPKTPIKGLGSPHHGGFNTAFADGSIKFLKNSTAPAILDALATRTGSEVIAPTSY